MIINHNIAALNTYRQLNSNSTIGQKSLERLSSGLRINRAGDDAAGLAISEKMRGQIRGLDQASANAQDGISMIQTAEGSLNETHSILQRMKELATQAANDTNVSVDRNEIQKEINQLTSEINRIGNTTEFNTQKLLNGAGVTRSETAVDTTTAGAAKGAISALQTVTAGTTKANASVVVAGRNGADDAAANITISANNTGQFAGAAGQGLQIEIAQGTTGQAAKYDAAANKVTIYADIAGTKASVTNLTASLTAGGLNNDITITGANGATDQVKLASSSLLNGGVDATKGVYSFDVETFMTNTGVAGQNTVSITTTDTDVSGAQAIDINDLAAHTTKEEQAKLLAAAFALDDNFSGGNGFDVIAIGSTIQFTQKVAGTGTLSGLTATTTATAGDYDINIDSLVADGGKYVIDGHEIKVTSDATDSGIADGTAILVGTDKNAQAANLAVAITRNANLKDTYIASNTLGSNKVNLLQRQGQESATAPDVVSYSKDGKFIAKFQIGANTAQSMTIEVNDMRSAALKVAGNDAGGTVTATNGSVASYKAVMDVTNGTDNTGVEYALDVSDHDKATAAISVIQDAIETVSAERSKLGAYQNRLEHTINNLGTSSENLTAAESRIRDVDMAKEMMEFTKNNILSQAAQAMLEVPAAA